MQHMVSGTEAANREKPWWEQIIETLHHQPDVVGKIISPLADAVKSFMPSKNYIINTPPAPVGRTEAKIPPPAQEPAGSAEPAPQNTTVMEEKLTEHPAEEQEEDLFAPGPDGMRHNPFLQETERGLKNADDLVKERIEKLSEDQAHDFQMGALDAIEARIGAATLTRMLTAVALLNDKDLNKLLTHLD